MLSQKAASFPHHDRYHLDLMTMSREVKCYERQGFLIGLDRTETLKLRAEDHPLPRLYWQSFGFREDDARKTLLQ